jgi:hypothetical protein
MVPYRLGRWRYTIGWRPLRLPFSMLYRVMKLASQILTGIDLPCEVTIGHRFRIEHFGGIIVSGDTVIGDDCILRNGVTIGMKKIGEPGSPRFSAKSTSATMPRLAPTPSSSATSPPDTSPWASRPGTFPAKTCLPRAENTLWGCSVSCRPRLAVS